MKNLYDKTEIKGLTLKNRFIRSALHEALAEKDGQVSQRTVDFYEEMAKGGLSTIVTGFCSATPGVCQSPSMISAADESFIPGLKKLTDAVHKHDTNIILQFAECGSQSKFNFKKRVIYGPSAVEHKYTKLTPVEMSVENIKEMVYKFGDAAARAKEAGFDGVQIHGAHGYMLSQFLTPYYNRREDQYGGSIENRARIIFEIYENMRSKVGENFPIWIKINCSDFMGDEGLTFEESRFICKKLDEMGIDLIEVSGNVAYNENPPQIISGAIHKDKEKQCYFSKYAKTIAEEVKAPVSVVGGNRNTEMMTEILNSSNVQYISLARTILCEADLVNKWKENPSYNPKCISCNKCWSLRGNICIFNRKKAEAPSS